jgi:2-methylcitrate dehydratase PrpD
MKSFALPGAVLAISGVAAAASPFDGRWAFDREICANKPGDTDMVPLEIKGDQITTYVSACTIVTIDPIGNGLAAWRVSLSCLEEGDETEAKTAIDAIFALYSDPDGNPLTLIEIDMASGTVDGYYPCP